MRLFALLIAATLSVPSLAQNVARPLTAMPGDPDRGVRLAVDADKGNCAICHALPIPQIPVFGNLGPSLAGVGSRLSEQDIRQMIVDPKVLHPGTIMPAYFRVPETNVAARYAGQTILTAQEIEDIVSYLVTLR